MIQNPGNEKTAKKETAAELQAEGGVPAGRNYTQVTKNIQLGSDGVYRWMYEFRMMKNPTILFTLWKVLGLSFGIVALFMFVLALPDLIRYGPDFFETDWRVPVILIAVFLLISLLSYLIAAAAFGWKYIVIFEMSETGVTHTQLAKQYQKMQAFGILLALAGAKSGNIGAVGQGLLAASRNQSTTEFNRVRKIRLKKRRDTIFANQLLYKNQIYAEKEDFDFVADYIIRHCPNAKVKGK